ncbi:MAG: hypothetical protein QXU00_01630 [Ignisphaera sp.]
MIRKYIAILAEATKGNVKIHAPIMNIIVFTFTPLRPLFLAIPTPIMDPAVAYVVDIGNP